MINAPGTAVRREMASPTLLGSLILGILATVVSFAVVDIVFASAVQSTVSLDVRSRIHFSLPSQNLIFDLICSVASATAFRTRTWILATVAGLVGYAVILPMYGGSGAITNFMSLIFLHIDLLGVALVLDMLLAVIWIRESKRVSRRAGSLSCPA